MSKKLIDIYEVFELKREMSCEQIIDKLKEHKRNIKPHSDRLQAQMSWRAEVSLLDSLQQQSIEISERLQLLEEAKHILCEKTTREQYDNLLDEAYRTGELVRKRREATYPLISEAEHSFIEQDYERAALYAKEAMEVDSNDEESYIILAKALFALKFYDDAYEVAEKAAEAFHSSADMQWLSIRLNIITNNYVIALARIMNCEKQFPEDMRFPAERVFLQVYCDHLDRAQSEMDWYFKENPDNDTYRKQVAYILTESILQRCVYDKQSGFVVITEKNTYEACSRLIDMALSVYSDDYIRTCADSVAWFGSLVYDERFDELRKFYLILGIVILLIGFAIHYVVPALLISLLTEALAIFVRKFGYRPGWMVAKESYTGISQRQDGAIYTILQLPQIVIEQVIAGFTNG